jgi:arylsulfatase A-like enzyme
MTLQRLDVLDNTWYPIIWIAAIFNGLLVGAAGVVVTAILAKYPGNDRLRRTAVFSLFMLALVPVLALMLEEWIYAYAIVLLTLGTATVCTRWYWRHDAFVKRASPRIIRVGLALVVVAAVTTEGGTWLQERTGTARLPPAAPSAPNVLLIVVDTLRSDHLSSYGYSRQTSPAIDALAAQGVLFENAFSTASYTLPSHASILTGRFPTDHGVKWNLDYRRPKNPVPTLPLVLQSQGYRTAAFSANTIFFTREHGFGRGFLHFEDFFHSVSDMAWRTAYGAIARRYARGPLGLQDIPARKLAVDVTRAAEGWMSQDPERPFFVTMNFMDVHGPYLPPQPYRNQFSSTPDPGGLVNFTTKIPTTLTPAEVQSEIDAYDGGIAYVDAEVSRLMAWMSARPSSRDLLVILTSDHGEEFGEHGGFDHGRHLYREVIQVPLIVWGPGRVAEGMRVSRPVTNAAIPATLMSLLGADPAPFLIPSLQPLWDGTGTDTPDPVSELAESGRSAAYSGALRSIVSGPWHCIEEEDGSYELFAWLTDRKEAHNLASPEAGRAATGACLAQIR